MKSKENRSSSSHLSAISIFFSNQNLPNMVNSRIEIGLISARGLWRTSAIWKLQWFAVGWINPSNKYCTKINSRGGSNPSWNTKFSTVIDDSNSNLSDLVLNVEVYSRDPIFLREKLYGTSKILLKEFLAKFTQNSEVAEVGSFQLRKGSSGKPRGFVDVSVRIASEEDGVSSRGNMESFEKITDKNDEFTPYAQHQPVLTYPRPQYPATMTRPEYYPPANFPTQVPSHYPNSNTIAPGANYPRATTPPPPPPPSHVGFIPTFLPGSSQLPESYINLPSRAGNGRPMGPGFAMGAGAGAMAAGAVIFGDDFMSAFDYPSGFQGGSLTISADDPF